MPLPRQFLVRSRVRSHLSACISRLNRSGSSTSSAALTFAALQASFPSLLALAVASSSSSSSSHHLSNLITRAPSASRLRHSIHSSSSSTFPNFSWAIFIIGILHCLVWSIGVTESFSRDFFARQQFSLTGGAGFPDEATLHKQQQDAQQQAFHRQLEATRELFLVHLEHQASLQRALDCVGGGGGTGRRGGTAALHGGGAHLCDWTQLGVAAFVTFLTHYPNSDDDANGAASSESSSANTCPPVRTPLCIGCSF